MYSVPIASTAKTSLSYPKKCSLYSRLKMRTKAYLRKVYFSQKQLPENIARAHYYN